MCVQYLTLLIDYFQVNTLKAVSTLHDLECTIQELLITVKTDDDDADDTDGNEEEQQQHVVSFYHNNEQEESLQEIRKTTKPNDVVIVYNNGEKGDAHNGIYIVTRQKPTDKDTVGGAVCTLLLQIGASVISSVALLVAKQVRKYLKKHNNKKMTATEATTVNKEEEKEGKKPKKKKVNHMKFNKQEGKGESLWDKITFPILEQQQ